MKYKIMEINTDILNMVHNIAALSWNIKDSISPTSVAGGSPRSPSSFSQPSPTNRPIQSQNQINTPTKPVMINVRRKINDSGNTSGRRIQPVSTPRKPPDVQDATLFPSLSEATQDNSGKHQNNMTPKRNPFNQPFAKHEDKSGISNTQEQKLRKLEFKFISSVARMENDGTEDSPWGESNKSKKTGFINNLQPKKESGILSSKEVNKAPRSAEFFAELTPVIAAQVDKVAEQYSNLLDNNLCRNVLDEFTVLLKIISSSRADSTPSLGKINQLSSVAQQVYFVIKVLTLQLNSTLCSVDPQIIQVLIKKYPHRLPRQIRKHFNAWVESEIEKKALHTEQEESSHKPSEYHQCVTFRSETDGRANFPNQGDFHAFCKQRDLFYSIKTLWTEKEQETLSSSSPRVAVIKAKTFTPRNSRNNATTMRESDPLYSKIKAFFNINSSWANLSHFASLFTSQFILDSMEEGRKHNESGEIIQDEQMRSILQSNPDRFEKLNNRMSTKLQSENLQKDYIAFQKYFLTTASCPAFNQHLIDRISFEISEIEATLENSGCVCTNESSILLRKCVLLSKLLGYVVFLPYSNEGPSIQNRSGPATIEIETLLSNQLKLRSNQRPPIDLKSMITTSLRQNRLTFTLPWVIEFLTAADSLSFQIPAYTEVIKLICSIYHVNLKVKSKKSSISLSNRNFLRFWCGSLFSYEKFPTSLLYCDDNDNIMMEQLKQNKVKKDNDVRVKQANDDRELPIDCCGSVGDKLLRFYFSSKFNEMTYILHAGLQQQEATVSSDSNIISSTEAKHIRPVPAKSPLKCIPISREVQLQLQLESSFFDSNSPSVQKSVDFLADRIASNYVKNLRTMMAVERTKLALQRIFEDEAAIMCKRTMLDGLNEFLSANVMEGVKILVGDSISSHALSICQKIAERKCTEKVVAWVQSHIKGEMFPVIDDLPDLQVPSTTEATKTVEVTNNSTEFELTFVDMRLLHRCLKQLHQGKSISEEHLDKILKSRGLKDCPSLTNSLIDFGLAVITFAPASLTSIRQHQLISLWEKNWNSECRLLCPRNLVMLEESSIDNKFKSWEKLGEIVKRLIQAELISLETVEQDCLSIVRDDWSFAISTFVSHLLKEVSASAGTSTTEGDKSRDVIEWVAWYCSNPQDGEGEF